MKIGWLSSWPPRHCGIATYSTELVQELRKKRHQVHILCHPDGGAPGEKNVYPVLDTTRPGWDEAAYQTVHTLKPDVVHIQHEYGLYQTGGDHAAALFRLLFRWQVESKFPVVVTYHSVYTRLNRTMALYMDVMQRLLDAGIVHETYQWVHLPANIGRTIDNIYVIPHGASVETKANRKESKQDLGVTGKKVLGMLGWFTETKGFHRVLELWDHISEILGPETVLVLAGDARRGDPAQLEYRKILLDLVDKCRFKERIKLVLGSFEPTEYEKVLSSFDAMIMPYSFASQSGNMAHSFALGVPVVVSALEGLKAEIEESGAGIAVAINDGEELERAILSIMKDDSLRDRLSRRAREYVRHKISWSITVDKHLRLYKKLVAEKKRKRIDPFLRVSLETDYE
jgi:glycosyltransferase involved in cell wall biosynthesis